MNRGFGARFDQQSSIQESNFENRFQSREYFRAETRVNARNENILQEMEVEPNQGYLNIFFICFLI